MKISVAHARGAKGNWYQLDLPEPVTAQEALQASPVFHHYPDLDLATHRIGIFGKFCTPDTVLKEGDRVEIYLPVTRQPDEDEDDDE
ncbi:MAG: RnfH family protein [Tolumonas sp.]|uniref:RnfH family protein n=1 Tax=uncultured Tolumonas sp. TaxID=263765 RepID=UPI002A0A4BC4|nr:RnfH family protein [uncultured Tolumonas sp.]MDD2343359.1 RnfH family protein [Tolumonas sp.]MDD2841020.1 RnfH family protein [Tolumonas sp.]